MFNLMILMFEDLAAAAWYLVCCWRLHPRGEQLHFGQIFLASLHRIYTLQGRFVVFLCSVHLHCNPTAIINKKHTDYALTKSSRHLPSMRNYASHSHGQDELEFPYC
jgi:hypothetical protein